MPNLKTMEQKPKYLTAKVAASIYGVHRDFFRKTAELRRERVVLSTRTHLYPIEAIEAFFAKRISR